MYIKKVGFSGIKGIENYLELDFTPNNDKFCSENTEDFGLKRNASEFKILKQIGFIGLNSSGKSSILTGIDYAINLLTDPYNYLHNLLKDKNIFVDNKHKFSLEVVFKPISSKSSVIKYFIDYEIDNGKFVSEKVDFISATSTLLSKKENLYSSHDGTIHFGKSPNLIMNFNNKNSFMFAIISGMLIDEKLKEMFSEHIDYFKNISTYTRIHMKKEVNDILSIQLQKDKLYEKKMSYLLSIFDPMIKNIKLDLVTNKHALVFEKREKTISIPIHEVLSNEIFSTGTHLSFGIMNDIIKAYNGNDIIILDELGKSIHDGLFINIFEMLRQSKSQIIFATHNSELFETFIRNDQLFNIQINENKEISVKRFDELDISNRSMTKNNVSHHLKNHPDPESLLKIFEVLNE